MWAEIKNCQTMHNIYSLWIQYGNIFDGHVVQMQMVDWLDL